MQPPSGDVCLAGTYPEDLPDENRPRPDAPKTQSLTYRSWCSKLTSLVLRTRTAFSAFLHFSIRISKSSCQRGGLAPTFFPIPVPSAGAFDRRPTSPSRKRRTSLFLSRAVHVVAMALNFWHFDGSFGGSGDLWRRPNAMHRKFYGFVKSLVKSDGLDVEIDALRSGRKNPELFARLFDLVECFKQQGTSANPYDRTFHGFEVPRDDERYPELLLYRDLDPSRLKVSGKAKWGVSEFLSEDLLMAYREPMVLRLDRIPEPWEYPRLRDSQETIFQLAKLWDSHGLLLLHQEETEERRDFEKVRIFNAYKNVDCDRQIGDRRGRNAIEAVVKGPSSSLPAGSDLCDLAIDASTQRLSISISDRKDYYHQLKVTKRKAICNTLGPGLPSSWLEELDAYGVFLLESAKKRRYDRLRDGDLLGSKFQRRCQKDQDTVWVAFNSVLQGDHCGVDIATEAHTQLLQSYGLLSSAIQLTADKPWRHESQVQGLVIDDFFAVSVEDRSVREDQTEASKAYTTAQQAYNDVQLSGSPEKDVCGADEGKAIGAYLNSSARALSRGICTVGAPIGKRLSLATISLQLAQLSHTTCGLHSCVVGAWVSMMIYRRPLMSIFNHSFRLVSNDEAAMRNHEAIHLPRQVAQEITLAAVLAPVMMTNIAAPYDEFIYASDASESKGAFCKAAVSKQVHEVLFRSCRSKGAYTKLLSPIQALLVKLNEFEETGEEPFQQPPIRPGRPLAFVFEFLEVFSGASRVTEFVASMGIVCGPPIDISVSEEFDMKHPRLVAWISHLICEGILKGVLLEPPCTTFSVMRRPALRDRLHPFGFDVNNHQTKDGNILAHRALQLAFVAAVNEAIAVVEKPHSSKMRYLPAWEILLRLAAASLVRSDSCQFGSIHRKSFSFLGINVDLSPIALRCQGTCSHVQIQGAYTKSSATYVPKLAYGLAHCIAQGIFQMRQCANEESPQAAEGLENQLVNEVMLTSTWQTVKAWSFKGHSHINLLELKAAERLVESQAKKRLSLRFVSIVDSNVSRGALAKGRSASLAVSAILRRINSTLVAADLYMVNPFCPTRLNVADDPTRDNELCSSVRGLSAISLTRDQLFDLATLPKLRRWASNWARLIILLNFPSSIHWQDRSLFRRSSIFNLRPNFHPASSLDYSCLDFDSTLGYPGEGPVLFHAVILLLLCGFWISSSILPWNFISLDFGLSYGFSSGVGCCCFLLPSRCCVVGLLLAMPGPISAMELGPITAAERRKAEERATRPSLPVGRPTLEVTSRLRERYWKSFLDWTRSEGIDFLALLSAYHLYVDEINAVLIRYGRTLYTAGKPYTVYAETINMLSAKKPVMRRQLQGAWDLAFSWVQAEPSAHHVAMPWQVLLAMVTVALMWGWTDVAGCLSLGWGALLRAGEILMARRRDLLLPRDVDETICFALLAINEPKTRHTGPKHQAAKLDIPDLLQVTDLAFGDKSDGAKLWEQSGQTLRLRFKEILKELCLPVERESGMKPLDVGSLRAGGATWHLQVSEDGEYTRRKGRWLSLKVMEVYVQETAALLYLKRISSAGRQKVIAVAGKFPQILAQSLSLKAAHVPKHVWYQLHNTEDLWRGSKTIVQDGSGRVPCCKTIKLVDDPSVEQLHTQLVILTTWMKQLVQHGHDFDFSLDDSDGTIHEQFANSATLFTSASWETAREKVRQLQDEVQEAEQAYNELNMQLTDAESKLQRAHWETRCLRREEGARYSEEFQTLSDHYAAEISKLDEHCKDLRKDQKGVKECHEDNLKKKRAFVQLEKLMQVKLKDFNKGCSLNSILTCCEARVAEHGRRKVRHGRFQNCHGCFDGRSGAAGYRIRLRQRTKNRSICCTAE
eukprot:s1586_g23.t1